LEAIEIEMEKTFEISIENNAESYSKKIKRECSFVFQNHITMTSGNNGHNF
jgi:hypothetical protein